jgi:hypothetical protein
MFLHPPTNFKSREIYLRERRAAPRRLLFLDASLDIAELETEIVESLQYVHTHAGFILKTARLACSQSPYFFTSTPSVPVKLHVFRRKSFLCSKARTLDSRYP